MPVIFNTETQPGQPVTTGGLRLLPFAQSVSLRLPGDRFGLVWNRPVSLLVTDADGREQVLDVPDPTRKIVWTLYGLMAFLAIVVVLWKTLRRIAS
jgi:hypothetical protein